MTKQVIALALLALAGGTAFAAQTRRTTDAGQGSEPVPVGDNGQSWFDGGDLGVFRLPVANDAAVESWTAQNQSETAEREQAMTYTPQPTPAGNLAAIREAIAFAEGTATQGDPYRVCFGYRYTIRSLADHPAVTGEWRGEPLSDAMCAGAGYGPGCVSTAAGKYQIKKSTWLGCKSALKLPDFSPASQDRACAYLIEQRGAMADVVAGRFTAAVTKMRKEWASLPGAGYGQGERSIAWLTAKFEQAGGVVIA